MEVIIRPNAELAAKLAAQLIGARLRAKPDLLLGLATGRTMERVGSFRTSPSGRNSCILRVRP